MPKSKLGPVVDAEAFERLQNVTTSEHANATLVHRGQDVEGGYTFLQLFLRFKMKSTL